MKLLIIAINLTVLILNFLVLKWIRKSNDDIRHEIKCVQKKVLGGDDVRKMYQDRIHAWRLLGSNEKVLDIDAQMAIPFENMDYLTDEQAMDKLDKCIIERLNPYIKREFREDYRKMETVFTAQIKIVDREE